MPGMARKKYLTTRHGPWPILGWAVPGIRSHLQLDFYSTLRGLFRLCECPNLASNTPDRPSCFRLRPQLPDIASSWPRFLDSGPRPPTFGSVPPASASCSRFLAPGSEPSAPNLRPPAPILWPPPPAPSSRLHAFRQPRLHIQLLAPSVVLASDSIVQVPPAFYGPGSAAPGSVTTPRPALAPSSEHLRPSMASAPTPHPALVPSSILATFGTKLHPGSLLILFSRSGSFDEPLGLVPCARAKEAYLIVITSVKDNPLAALSGPGPCGPA